MNSISQIAGNVNCAPMASRLSEQKNTIQDESGYMMHLDEITFNQIDLKWGSYTNPNEKILSFHPDKPAVVSHFRISDVSRAIDGKWHSIPEKQFVIYRESSESYDLRVAPTKDEVCSFFELSMSEHFLNNMLTDESEFLNSFHNYSSLDIPCFDFTAPMTPAMFGIINDMRNSPYSGYLKGIHLEAKAIELFLMQVQQLDQKDLGKQSKLQSRDIECLHEIRNYIALHYEHHCSIIDLSRKAGINQMKLKNGFKSLFGTTVFGYLNDIRLQEAKRLLVEEKMYVSEVADRIGYKHPHHFTAAFKKKFGITPKALLK